MCQDNLVRNLGMFKYDFPTFSISIGDFILQKISENIISNWEETECKNKIKDARAQGTTPPSKHKNIIPPTSRFKKSMVQSLKNYNIAESSTAMPHTMSSSRSSTQLSATSSKAIEVDDSSDYNGVFELLAVTSRTIKLSSSSRIPTRLSTTSSNTIVINDDNNASEFFTVNTPLATRSSRSSNPAGYQQVPKQLGSIALQLTMIITYLNRLLLHLAQ
ncbi:19645_t:CDS:2 [Gigaspora rosea]|nr:19645_t:CDS:2 [Gigaspora rosea]